MLTSVYNVLLLYLLLQFSFVTGMGTMKAQEPHTDSTECSRDLFSLM